MATNTLQAARLIAALDYYSHRYGHSRLGRWLAVRDARAAVKGLTR